MHVLRVYVDNSVFGGVFDDEFADASKLFFEQAAQGRYRILISEITLAEIADAPERVRQFMNNLAPALTELIPLGDEAETLAQAYINTGIVNESSRADATQVAGATIAKADLIVSWNFKHIVNFDRIHKYNAVNLLNGYAQIEIRSPSEVVYGDES